MARIPITVFSVLFVTQAELQYGRIAIGGTATLLYAAGATVNGVASGWLLQRLGDRVVATCSSAAVITVLLVSALPGERSPAHFVALAGLIGLCYPPLHISSRARYPRLVRDPFLLKVYSWDVSLIQLSWLVAPVLVVLLAGSVGITAVYLTLAAQTAVGAAWYLLTLARLPARDPVPQPLVATARGRGLLRSPDLHVYLISAAAMMLVSGMVMPVIVEMSGSSMQESGAILVWSAGSAVGSLLVNRGAVRRRRLVAGVAVAIVAGGLVAAAPSLMGLVPALLLLGFATSPVTGAMFYFVSLRYEHRSQAYVFGMITSAQLVAQGVGSSLSGRLLDRGADVWVTVIVLGSLGVLLALLALNIRGTFGPRRTSQVAPLANAPCASVVKDASV